MYKYYILIVLKLNIVFDVGKVLECYEYLFLNVMWLNDMYINDENYMKLMSYIWDNVWVVVWWH